MVDVFEKKWSLRILNEIYLGNTHFNQLKRQIKGITPALLSKRLKEFEKQSLISRKLASQSNDTEYILEEKAREVVQCWGLHSKLKGLNRAK